MWKTALRFLGSYEVNGSSEIASAPADVPLRQWQAVGKYVKVAPWPWCLCRWESNCCPQSVSSLSSCRVTNMAAQADSGLTLGLTCTAQPIPRLSHANKYIIITDFRSVPVWQSDNALQQVAKKIKVISLEWLVFLSFHGKRPIGVVLSVCWYGYVQIKHGWRRISGQQLLAFRSTDTLQSVLFTSYSPFLLSHVFFQRFDPFSPRNF